MKTEVLIDTNFLIYLLDKSKDLHRSAMEYYKYFVEHRHIIKISTITIAEYCVKGNIDEIPLQKFQIIPFNIIHAENAGQLMREINCKSFEKSDRSIIKNDIKLLSQANKEKGIKIFVTADKQLATQMYKSIKSPSFKIYNINNPISNYTGQIPFKDE